MNERSHLRAPDALSPWKGSWWSTYLLLFLVWTLGNYPALIHSWWYRDDFVYGLLVVKTSTLTGLEQIDLSYLHDGRPLAIFVEWPFCLNYYPHAGINIALHWAQGAGHVALASLIVSILSRHLPRWQAVVATAPFLLWAFNGEPVLYTSAYHYVAAASLSILGLHFILEGSARGKMSSYRLGAILTASAPLMLQASATAGLIVWSVTVALRLLDSEARQKSAIGKEGAWLSLSFFIGGLLTTLVALTCKSVRAEGATDLPAKIHFWIDLNRTFFFWPDYYPPQLDLLHGVLLLLGLAIPAFFLLKSGRAKILFLITGLFLATLILPYLGNLVTAANWMSYRTFYLAPLELTFITAMLFSLAGTFRWLTVIITLLVAAICLNYVIVAQNNARDYVTTYVRELQVVHEVEKLASENQLNVIAILPATGSSNPFGVHYPWLDGHECDFGSPYSGAPSICLLSSLRILAPTGKDGELLLEKIHDHPIAPGVQVYALPELHLIYLQVN